MSAAAVGGAPETVRALAERLLFGATVEDKLWAPPRLNDAAPGPALPEAPLAPGRPEALRFRRETGTARARFPKGAAALASPEARGVALHFFANHELLALELMALVLLRFPEAPPAFRRGVVATIRDEQRHLAEYLRRMGDLGVPFGAVPVSDFFWATLRDLPDAASFAANLSLVFEQANLDFALQYAKAFHAAGDEETGAVLQTVLRDEIRHVAHGVRWLRRWSDPQQPFWDEWLRRLLPPLTPARAKGAEFEAGPRRQAGLDADFVERLRLFVHTRGRVPDVWWFDPTVEDQARAPHERPTDAVRTVWRDLAPLMAVLAARDDVVLVPEVPSPAWQASWLAAERPLPEFVAVPPLAAGADSGPAAPPGRSLGRLRPWGDGPQVRRFAASWSAAGAEWGAVATAPDCYGKPFAARLRTDAAVCADEAAVQEALAAIEGPARIKAAFGTAGRDQLRVPAAEARPRLDGTAPGWLRRTLARHGAVVVEPEYDKVLDLSALFEVEADGSVRHLGLTRFDTDAKGTWRGTWVGEPTHGFPSDLLRFFAGDGDRAASLPARLQAEAERVGAALHAAGHRGPAGIDALVARQPSGGFTLVPLLEVNPRHTMGHVALRLARRLAPGACGRLWMASRADLRAGGHADFPALAQAWAEALPVVREGTPPRWSQGTLALADPDRAQLLLPLWLVGAPERLRALAPSN